MINSTLAEISKSLTKEVIDKAFKLRTNSQDIVKSVEVTRAAPAGEGLLSAVFRIQVRGEQHTASFIVKGLATDPLLRKTLDCTKYFKREVDFFSKILPVLSKIQTSLGAKERIQKHIPICYGSYYDGFNDYILLEDLSESNCHSVCETPTKDEKNGVLQTLAHLHAVSMALRIKNPEEFENIASSLSELYYIEENRDWFSKYLQNAIDIDRKVMAELEDVDSVYSKKFNEVLSKDLYGQCISSVSSRGDHPVLCHGDAWGPNFLYSQDRMVVIDFQLFRCASPATDLAYWIMMCSTHSTVKQDFLDAVELYYVTLEYYLRDMGLDASKVFPRDTLIKELKLFGRYGYLACLTSLPLMSADKCNGSISMEEKFSGVDRIPLEHLWQMTQLQNKKDKLRLRNAIRVAVDVELI